MSQTSVATPSEFAELVAEYEFFGELGRGGSAVVYRGRDRGLGRDVAIKVVHPRPLSADDDAVARLAREARTIAQLQHPNIVTVYAVRRLSGGGLALVMQLVPGRTLKAVVLEDGPLPADRCQRILRDVASALAYAHSRGVVHRDVKPENIFLDEETDQVLLADFGIARSLEHDSSTLTGTAIGTPFYMSPEQIDGVPIDGRSDLYSLGLVAWELLTGRRPWDGESLYNVIAKQKQEELPPIEALRPGVPLRLQYIVERMLQKNPAARWAGAEGLLSQLSHSVMPSDYGRWQAALRKRVERFHAAERDRERARAEEPPSTSGGLLASTMRFVRGAPSKAGSDAGSGASLAHTTIVTVDGKVKALAPEAIEPPPPAAVDAATPVAPPTWAHDDRRPRWLVRVAIGIGGVALAAAAVFASVERARDTLGVPAGNHATPPPEAPASAVRAVSAANAASAPATPGVDDSPAPVAAPVALSRLALGTRHSCVIEGGGVVRCWGANERGQLGDGTAARQTRPVRVSADLRFATVTAGGAHSCAATSFGDVYCWGSDSRGQLGDATTVRRNAPVRVAGPGIYRTVTAGDAHTCALTVNGAIHCWGANDHGQLGDGSSASRSTPTAVAAPEGELFAEVALGTSHSCARTERGAVYCWGANDRGQLGVPGPDRQHPSRVPDTSRFVAIAAGNAHTCAVTAAGAVRCWGANAHGQLGTGSRGTGSPVPQTVRLAAPAARIALGAQHSCVLLDSGEAFCWGAKGAGQLGSPTTGDALVPTRVATDGPFAAIAAGGAHTCGVTQRGGAVCWGDNTDGQLGDASRVARRAPAAVSADTRRPAAAHR